MRYSGLASILSIPIPKPYRRLSDDRGGSWVRSNTTDGLIIVDGAAFEPFPLCSHKEKRRSRELKGPGGDVVRFGRQAWRRHGHYRHDQATFHGDL